MNMLKQFFVPNNLVLCSYKDPANLLSFLSASPLFIHQTDFAAEHLP